MDNYMVRLVTEVCVNGYWTLETREQIVEAHSEIEAYWAVNDGTISITGVFKL